MQKRALVILALLAVTGLLVFSLVKGRSLDRYDLLDAVWPGKFGTPEQSAREPAKKPAKSRPKGGTPKPYSGKLPSLAGVNIRDAVLDKIIGGLEFPWSMEFISGHELLINEFAGAMQLLDLEDLSLTEIQGLPEIPSGRGQIGLMDLVLHPEFATNGLVYFSHASRVPDGAELFATTVSRARLEAGALQNVTPVFVAEPFGKSPANFGGAMAFDAAGLLYVATGDRSERDNAQNPASLHGKIIRLFDDGSVPPDNPFVGDETVDDRIYAMGLRNPQGLVFDDRSGVLYETEHGPMGGDEVNRILPGRNYGWPVITYGANYTTQKIGVGTASGELQQPIHYYLPSLAISPVDIYRGDMFPEWNGHLLVGALKGAHLNLLDLQAGTVISEQRVLNELRDRVRDVKVAADGSVYLLTQNRGRLYRLYRNPGGKGLESPKLRGGRVTYELVCASCHSANLELVPQIDDPASWEGRLEQDVQVLYQNALEGVGTMPAKGLCEGCLDAEIESAVDYMLGIIAESDLR